MSEGLTRQSQADRLCAVLRCRYPILQAGMGGVARAELVAATAGAGGYGCLGMVREPPEFIAEQIDAVRAQTDKAFAVNIIPAATDPSLLSEQLAVCVDKNVHGVSLFWDVQQDFVERVKSHGLRVLHQVGSTDQAQLAAKAGADVIIAQGFEAGGHVHRDITSLVLVPEVVQAVGVPVVASGGFASGESLVAAWALGAAGIQCGTAFLATRESFAHDYHKQRVVEAGTQDTVHTEVFAINWPKHSPVRVLRNSVTRAHDAGDSATSAEPIAFEEGRPILRASTDSPLRTTDGDLEALALYAGQVVGQIDSLPTVQERIGQMLTSARRTLARLPQPHLPDVESDEPTSGKPSPYASSPCYQHEFPDDPSDPSSNS